MKLYYHPISGHAHRAYLFLSLIGAEHELIEVNLAAGAHKTPEYLKMNRFGQIPVLDDDGTIIADSNAILVYLAKKYRKTDWLPETPAGAAAVQRWLSVAAGQIAFGPAAARVANLFNRPINKEEVLGRANAVLKVIDDELAGRTWIAAANPTIADVALYSYIARAGEGDIDLAPYANVNAWLARIEALPGFVEFRKTPVKKAG